MISIISMMNKNTYRTFILFEDGSAKEDGNKINDFAKLFIQLVETGWKKITETNLGISSAAKNRSDYVSKTETFREQWNEYLSEYSDNLEVDFT